MKEFMNHDFNINKIVLACMVKGGAGKRNHQNRANHGLALFLGGERTIVFENTKKMTVKENTIVYFPKGSNYVIKEKIPSDCYAINFDMWEDIAFQPFSIKIKNVNTFLEGFKVSQKIWTNRNTGYNTKVKAELYSIIYTMQSEYALPYKGDSIRRIQPAVSYIHSNYSKGNISVSYLASLCNMSTVHLRNIFVKNFGITPNRYISNLKMLRAKELLESNLYTVSEVCFLSGFSDESYFSRKFKKEFGIAPCEYAREAKS